MSNRSTAATLHQPVMLTEALTLLAPRAGGRYLDATVGLGGHAEALLDAIGREGRLLGTDADSQALAIARERLSRFGAQVSLRQAWLDQAPQLVAELDLAPLDGVLCDLGVSSLQLDSAERGFSLQQDGPLDMRMAQRADGSLTADEIVNRWSEGDLADLIYQYGEERRSRRIARAIVQRRPIASTVELADAVVAAVGMRPRKRAGARVHPATRVFQAIRLEVNQELERLARFLSAIRTVLRIGGRLVVIAFHSLEDRIVKRFLRDASAGASQGESAAFRTLTRRVLRPSEEEIARNPRARSARLRAAEAA